MYQKVNYHLIKDFYTMNHNEFTSEYYYRDNANDPTKWNEINTFVLHLCTFKTPIFINNFKINKFIELFFIQSNDINLVFF